MANYGLIGNIAGGLRETMNQYHTMQNMKRQEKMMGLLQGVQENPMTGEMEFTPEMKAKKDAEFGQYDPNSQQSKSARGLLGKMGYEVPEEMSGQQIKEYQPLLKRKGSVSDDQLKSATELRKEYQSRPLVKEFDTINSAYQKIEAATKSPSAAGDMSLIYGFMKLQDPGSTVREGEYATAENSGSVDQRVQAIYNKVLKGERLTPEQRADFLAQAKRTADVYANQLKGVEDEFGGLAGRYQVDSNLIYTPRAMGLLNRGKKEEPPPLADEDKQALEWAKKNPNNPKAKQILELNKTYAGAK